MIELIALVVALVALVRLSRLERELRALQRRLPPAVPPPPTQVPHTPPIAPPVAASAGAADHGVRVPVPRTSQAAQADVVPPLHTAPPAAPPAVPPAASATVPPLTADPVAPPADGDETAGPLERSIGERYLLYAGMIVLVLAVASFLRYAFEHEWLSPVVRVSLGAACGIALTAAGRWLAAAGYRPYGLFLSGGGLVMLFLSVYAAFAFYALLGQAPTFTLLALVAAGAALLADRDESLPMALLAVCGGFATPFLVGGRGDAQLTLFSYVAVLVAATAYLAHRRSWPWLTLTSFVLTVVTVWTWAVAHYTDAVYLRTEIFLTLYCAMFLLMVRGGERSSRVHPGAAGVLWAAPALYHLASLAILYTHPVAFLVYLVLASAVVIAVSVAREWPPLRLIGWTAVFVPLLVWLETPDGRAWLLGSTAGAVGIWILFLLTLAWLVRTGARPSGSDLVVIHASGLGLLAALYVSRADVWPPLAVAAAVLVLAAAHLLVWLLLRASPVAVHWLAVAGVLYAAAAAIGFEGRWLTIVWAAEAAAVTTIGVRQAAWGVRAAGVALFAVAAYTWLLGSPPPSRTPFVPFLNAHALAGVFVTGMLYVTAWAMRGVHARDDRPWHRQRAALIVGASAMTVLLVSIEIWSYWSTQQAGGLDAALARQLMLSAWWAGYAAALIAAGMRYHYPPVRYFAIALFGFTLLKVFAVDIWQLEGVYRVVGFLAVGSILLLASFLYQKVDKWRSGQVEK